MRFFAPFFFLGRHRFADSVRVREQSIYRFEPRERSLCAWSEVIMVLGKNFRRIIQEMTLASLRVCCLLSLGVSLFGGQQPKTASTPPELVAAQQIVVRVGDKPQMIFTEDDLSKLPPHSVTVQEHGKTIKYDGVLLHDVLARAGAPFGDELRGKALSNYVLATARDGYAVVYTLTEMDTVFSDGDLLLADKADGAPLPDNQGPFRIIATHDKKPARSLRMLERIDVVQLRK